MQKGRGFAGFTVNEAPIDDFALIIGRFILNFSAVEAASIFWWRSQARNVEELGSMIKKPFTKRVDRILERLPASSLSSSQREQASKAWSTAKEFAKVRNNLAHNPMTKVWTGRDKEGPPDKISLALMHTARGKYLEEVDSWDLSKLGPINDELVKLALQLEQLLERLPKPLP